MGGEDGYKLEELKGEIVEVMVVSRGGRRMGGSGRGSKEGE